jgi:YaiO family outer membrane protein
LVLTQCHTSDAIASEKTVEIYHQHHDSTLIRQKLTIAKNLLYKHKYDSCKIVLQQILYNDSLNSEAIYLYSEVGDWSRDYATCLYYSDFGLKQHPNNNAYLTKKLKSLYYLGKYKDAKKVISPLIDNKYSDKETDWLIPAIKNATSQKIILSHSLYYYYPAITRCHLTSAGYGFQLNKFFLIPKINAIQLIDNTSFGQHMNYQYAFEIYPKLKGGYYSYLSYGISAGKYHPAHFVMTEVYKVLSPNYGVDVGAYYMKFHDSNELYGLSLLAGIRKWQTDFMLKPYITYTTAMNADYNTTKRSNIILSYSFIAKKMYRKYQDYFTVEIRLGKTPFNPYFLTEDNKTFSASDFRICGETQYSLNHHISLKLALGYGHDKYSNTMIRKYVESNLSLITFLF